MSDPSSSSHVSANPVAEPDPSPPSEDTVEARILRRLDALDAKLDRLSPLLDMIGGGSGAMAAFVDVADVEAGRLREDGIDPMKAISNGARAAMEFGVAVGPREIRSLKVLLASGALDPEAIEVVSLAANALVETRARGCEPVGPLSLFGALRDPQVQKGLGFLVEVGRSFGAAMDPPPPAPASSRSSLPLKRAKP